VSTYETSPVKRPSYRSLTNSLQILNISLTTFLLVPLNIFNDEPARRSKMRKATTLTGKAAEYYFNSRCAFKIDHFETGMVDRGSSTWDKTLKNAKPYSMRLFRHELYPVLITEYKFNGKGPSFQDQMEMIMMNVTGDVM
jgi:hypothetical protein